jgi:hypothetical protein
MNIEHQCTTLDFLPDFSVDSSRPFFLNTKLLPIKMPKMLMSFFFFKHQVANLPLAIAKVTPINLYKEPCVSAAKVKGFKVVFPLAEEFMVVI